MNGLRPFHLAFKIKSIESAKKFYLDVLGCKAGRETKNWVDFNFFGHQVSGHVSLDFPELDYCGKVDDVEVPIPHFGCVLSIEEFRHVQVKLEENNIQFIVKPQLRYAGKKGEQLTLFTIDFCGNPIEFKAFTNEEEIFG